MTPHATPLQKGLVVALVAATAVSYVDAPYPADLTLHHVGTAAGIALLVWTMRRAPLSDASFAAVAAFLFLHVVAAHWLYSFVPYDEWTRRLFGFSVTETFGFRRNHFDRLVHFSFGALAVIPVREVLRTRARLRPWWARALSVDLVVSSSAVYELFEWGVAVVADPAHAERYNGQQGDPFDSQKDMAFAALGALVSTAAEIVVARRRARGP
jgi:putative membrane protein